MGQRMSINTKRELLLRFRREYLAADRQRKMKLLNGLIEATGYNRKYAIALLNQGPPARNGLSRTRRSKYGSDVIDVVRQLWRAANGICAKRLKPFLPTLVEALERCGHMKLDKQMKATLFGMSLSTLERMLKKERDKESKGKSLTRPGSLLKKQVAVKTFSEWNDREIGFFEVDLVAHCGGDISGRFMQTLTMTDIATGWTEIVPVLYKADAHVRQGMEKIIGVLPFRLKGIDCDNGKEFLNHEMVAWCKARQITFTRSRAYRKNDQAHVEEKHGSVVRRLVGYERFEGNGCCEVMMDLYSASRLYINYFQPCMKLVKKTRMGAKVTNEYDTAKTPLERLLGCKEIPKGKKAKLLAEFRSLDPIALLSEMSRLQAKLWVVASKKAIQSVPLPPSIAAKTVRKRGNHGSPDCPSHSESRQPMEQNAMPKRVASQRRRRAEAAKGHKDLQYSRIEITEGFVDNAINPPSGQIIYRDSKLIGFGLRLTPGSKSFVVEHRVNGKNSRITIGRAELFSVEEARTEAVQLLRHMSRGTEPLRLLKKKDKPAQ